MFTNKRIAQRRQITPLEVSTMTSLENISKISKGGAIIEASTTGFLMIVSRNELVPAIFRKNLNLDALIGTRVLLHLSQLNLEISGIVARTKFIGKAGFEIGIDYSADAPEYWRECLVDLLPAAGEFDKAT